MPHLENKSLWNYQDKKGTYLLQEMNTILKTKDETFYSWYWTKPDDEITQYEKLGLFKLFKPFEIFVGTGEYIVDFEKDIKTQLLGEINNYRYSQDGYIFVIRDDGLLLSYHDKEKLGKNIKDLVDVQNPDLFLKKLTQISKDNGYYTYVHSDKPVKSEHINITKTSYIQMIDGWNWFIGSGFYLDDFYNHLEQKKKQLEEDNKNTIENVIVICILITLFILIIFIYITIIIEKKFLNYKKNIKKQIDDNIKKDNLLAHQSKMASMGEMIGNIAHQWRQPLSTISTIATGLKMQKELGLHDEMIQIEAYDNINKQVQYLSSTIDDFRSFFKPEEKASHFTLNSLFDKTLNLIEAQFKSKNIEIIKDISSCNVRSLENELVQVLINILNNARDELIKLNQQRYIFIKANCDEKRVYIEIYDNAGGIDENIINRVFEPYFTTKHQTQGTGIGLFMCEEIVYKHLDGLIEVSNYEYEYLGKFYRGAKFSIELSKKIKS